MVCRLPKNSPKSYFLTSYHVIYGAELYFMSRKSAHFAKNILFRQVQ